jgi:hypothetical protein
VGSATCCCVTDTTTVSALDADTIHVISTGADGLACQGQTTLEYDFDFGVYSGAPRTAAGEIVFGPLVIGINITFDEAYNVGLFTNSLITECVNVLTREGYQSCDDGVQSGDEEGVDCGDICPACPAPATCEDEEMNGDETGVDCGGTCDACATCEDEIENQDETDVDCGGEVCNACPDETDASAGSALVASFAIIAFSIIAVLMQ